MNDTALLKDIRDFILAASNGTLNEGNIRFKDAGEMLAEIEKHIENAEFNPYFDNESCDILERAGIATYKHRNRSF